MKLTITQGNHASITSRDWMLDGRLSIAASTARRRIVTWTSGDTKLRAIMNWNASTQVVASMTVQFQWNGSWRNWVLASNIGQTYTTLTRTAGSALSRADVFDFRRSGRANRLYGAGGNDVFYGGSYGDYIQGGYGRDVLYGGGGNDRLQGDVGVDRLFGGAGRDAFRFNRVSDRGDIIADFRRGTDRIEFRSAGFGGLARGTLDASRFQMRAGSGAATGVNVRFVFNQANRGLYYDADGRGGRAPVKIATLARVGGLSNANITIA